MWKGITDRSFSATCYISVICWAHTSCTMRCSHNGHETTLTSPDFRLGEFRRIPNLAFLNKSSSLTVVHFFEILWNLRLVWDWSTAHHMRVTIPVNTCTEYGVLYLYLYLCCRSIANRCLVGVLVHIDAGTEMRLYWRWFCFTHCLADIRGYSVQVLSWSRNALRYMLL